MTITPLRSTAVLTVAIATVAMPVGPAAQAAHAPGARLDVGGAAELLPSAVSDAHVTITESGVHLGGDGWSGGTLLR